MAPATKPLLLKDSGTVTKAGKEASRAGGTSCSGADISQVRLGEKEPVRQRSRHSMSREQGGLLSGKDGRG